jgi:hypothetical protein
MGERRVWLSATALREQFARLEADVGDLVAVRGLRQLRDRHRNRLAFMNQVLAEASAAAERIDKRQAFARWTTAVAGALTPSS